MGKNRKNRLASEFNKKRAQVNQNLIAAIPSKNRIGTGRDGRIKLLYHGDSPKVNTGFGKVAREILGRLYTSGDYEIYSLGINDRGDTSDFFEAPGIKHFALPDLRSDPYGISRFPEVLRDVKPDVIFTLNDIWVLDGMERAGSKNWFIRMIKGMGNFIPWVFYFPVDSRPWQKDWADLAYQADKTIVYSKYAIDVLKEIYPDKDPIFISHGVSAGKFYITDEEKRSTTRKEMGVADDQFLVGFVARNQPRKNAAAAMEIFKMANEGYRKCKNCTAIRILEDPKCEYCGEANDVSDTFPASLEGNGKLYLHCHMMDPMGTNLIKVGRDNNLGDSVVYRPNHDIALGVPDDQFTQILNTLDVHLLPTMGEGYGLTVIETMSCGVINIATRSTAVTEQLEDGRGILVTPMTHMIFDDAATTRKHIIHPERAVLALKTVYEDWKKRESGERWGPEGKKMIEKAVKFCRDNDWDIMAAKFDVEIRDAINSRRKIVDLFSPQKNLGKQDQERRVLVIKNGSAGTILQTLPAMKKLKEKLGEETEIVYGIPENLCHLFQGRCDAVKEFVPVNKLTDKNPKNKNLDLMKLSLDFVDEKYEQGAYPHLQRSSIENYCLHAKQDISGGVSLKGAFSLTSEEIENGKKILKEYLGVEDVEEHFIVGISSYSEMRRSSWGEDNKNWNDVCKYLEKVGVKVYNIQENRSLIDNLSVFMHCNMVLTTETSILDFLYALDIPTVALISPFRVTQKIKEFVDNGCYVVYNKLYESHGVIENPNPNAPSPYIDTVGAGDMFTPCLLAYRTWKEHKKNAQKKEEVINA